MVSPSDFTSRTLYSDGRRIHVNIAGETGPLVLLCHGFPENWYSWRHQMVALAAAGYRTVAMDMRGYGRSAKPVDPVAYQMTELVGDCVAVVQSLGEARAVIVGHDLGSTVAWSAAWTRPDVFRAVVGMSVPFGGRGLAALPGDPFGERPPHEVQATIAGPDRMFYHEYFSQPGGMAAREAEQDVRRWLTAALYSMSADRPLPPELAGADLTKLPPEFLLQFVRSAMSMPRTGGNIDAIIELPETLPAWLSPDVLDHAVAELEYGGLSGPLNHYHNGEINWETLGVYQDKPVTVPALYIGGDRDIVTIWAQEAIARAPERVRDLRGRIIVPNCGHWIQQEQPEAVNTALLGFLASL
jgi:pimeloyl-ACP methyl ester carboxylesterase